MKKYKYKCKDIGMKCDFKVEGNSREEIIQVATLHAKNNHGMDASHPEVGNKITQAIKG